MVVVIICILNLKPLDRRQEDKSLWTEWQQASPAFNPNLTSFENIILRDREINISQFQFYMTEDNNLFAILLLCCSTRLENAAKKKFH